MLAVSSSRSDAIETVEPFAPGHQIDGDIVVVRHRHRGEDADVYDVWSSSRSCNCIAKVLRPERLDHPAARERLRREHELLARCTHPHVVRPYALLEREHALLLELVDGPSLQARIHRHDQPIAWPELVTIGAQIASALHHLHHLGSLHLDVTPSNVVLAPGRAVLIDAHLSRPRASTAPAGAGTRRYMAPEQVRGDELDAPADVWGWAATMFEAATGEAAYPKSTWPEGTPQLTHRAAPCRSLRALPRTIAECIDAGLHPDPADRPTLGEIAAHLNA